NTPARDRSAGRRLWGKWSAQSPRYGPTECRGASTAGSSPGDGESVRWLCSLLWSVCFGVVGRRRGCRSSSRLPQCDWVQVVATIGEEPLEGVCRCGLQTTFRTDALRRALLGLRRQRGGHQPNDLVGSRLLSGHHIKFSVVVDSLLPGTA